MTNEKPKEEPKAQPVSEPQNATPETAVPETAAPESPPETAAPESPPETATPESPHETPFETKIQDKDQDTAKPHESMSKDAPQDESPNVKKEEKISGDANKQSSSSKSISATVVSQSQNQTPPTFISPRDRLFGLSSEVHTFHTRLLEKASDGILKAAKIGDLQALKEFHEKGYSLLSIDSSGQTALHLASRYGHKDIIRYLIACAPSSILNMIDNDKGQTALHKAAQYKRRSICCMLVAGGATLIIKDRHGNTPRDLALQAEDRDLAAYLCSQEQFQLTTEEMENAL